MDWYKESQSKYDHIPKEHKDGDCFTQAFEYIVHEGVIGGNKNLQLIHAIICPLMGPLSGVEFGHAWVEDGDKVIDTSRRNEIMDKHSYYMLGGLYNFPTQKDFENKNFSMTIKEEKIHRYTVQDARKMAIEHGMYGPWEEIFEDFVINREDDNFVQDDEDDDGPNKY